MGHSVNSLGYRLSFFKNWKGGSVIPISPSLSVSSFAFYRNLDLYFSKFFDTFFPSFMTYSHFTYIPTQNSSLTNTLFVFVHFSPYQSLLKFFYRKKRNSKFNIFYSDWFSPEKPFNLLASRQVKNLNLNRTYLNFLSNSGLLNDLSELLSVHLLKNSNFSSYFSSLGLSVPRKIALVHNLNSPPTVQLLCRFIVRRLKMGKQRLARLVNSYILYNFSTYTKMGILGVAVHGFGRFTRTQRASKFSISRGTIPFSTVSANIHYFSSTVYLKYGACNIRIWLHFAPLR